MKTISIEDFTIKIAPDLTASFYKNIPTRADTESCGCTECTNYVNSCDAFSSEVSNFFLSLGIDPRKEADLFYCCQNDDGRHLYQGSYHFVGSIIDAPETNWFRIGNFEFAITNVAIQSNVIPSEFPKPICELSFEANIIWV